MPDAPETRPSLIVRLRRCDDEPAWEEFVAIYRPAIVRVAMLRGLQPTDAEDLAQQVLLSVARSVPKWEQDAQRAKFRTWLGRIVQNAATNALTRRRAERGIGGTTALAALRQVPDSEADLQLLEVERRRELYRYAADLVRAELDPSTWAAFESTAVLGLPAEEAARRSGKSIGAVYMAKCRVMQRLQLKVRELEGDDTP